MKSQSTVLALVLLAALSRAPASAQVPIHTLSGSGLFGNAVLGGGLLDGDAVPDLVVGMPLASPGGVSFAGSVQAFSGADGSLLWTFDGIALWGNLGTVVDFLDDINGDGRDEVVVGSPYEPALGNTEAGRVRVLSGLDGSVLKGAWGGLAFDRLGHSVAGLGDVDGDLIPDFAAGAPHNIGGATVAGFVRVYSGADGSEVFTIDGSAPGKNFGFSMAAAGDVDGDLVDDLIIGEPSFNAPGPATGRAAVHSGADGALIWSLEASASGDFLGWSVGGAGDVDGDGRGDLIAGAARLSGPGYARVYSGLTGTPLFTLDGRSDGDRFGFSVAGCGDFDLDGVPDVIVGAPLDDTAGATAGAARVYSGDCGQLLEEYVGSTGWAELGTAVAGAGLVDGDGYADVIIGAIGIDTALVHAGHATTGSTSYCTAGISASGCQAILSSSGTPSASAPAGFVVTASAVEGAKDGILYFGTNGRQANPWGNGSSYRCVAPPVKRGGLLSAGGAGNTCNGAISQDLNAHWTIKPAQNPGSGAVVQLQLWYRDPVNTSNQTTSLSDALEFTVCP